MAVLVREAPLPDDDLDVGERVARLAQQAHPSLRSFTGFVGPVRPVTPPEIVAAVSRALGEEPGPVLSPGREGRLMPARRTIAYVLHKRGNSYPRIARLMRRTDHSTPLHHVRQFDARATPYMRALAADVLGRSERGA